MPSIHIVDRYLATLSALGVQNDNKGLDFFLPQDMNLSRFNLPATFIALPIGAGRNTKALTIEKIVAICQQSQQPIALLGGPQEKEKAQILERQLKKRQCPTTKYINLVGQCSLFESAAIVQQSRLIITGDTGLMHIAAAFHKPIISVWGNTIPEFGMSPYYPKRMNRNISMEIKDLPCRPCSKIGYDRCPKGHFKCIEQLEVMQILEMIQIFF